MRFFLRLWYLLWRPSTQISVGALLIVGFVAGVLLWGGFNWAMELSNTEQFCISCHEMRDNVFEESKQYVHYSNRSGVHASCADCHVPRSWGPKIIRKIKASNELYHKILGTIDTREKFLAKRAELAERVWVSMKANDSRECRNCHDAAYMSSDAQQRRAWRQHETMEENNETCIDCHKGVAHEVPEDEEEEEFEELDFTI